MLSNGGIQNKQFLGLVSDYGNSLIYNISGCWQTPAFFVARLVQMLITCLSNSTPRKAALLKR
ncbi:hypothetical protein NCCP28_32430 [Niallia sp. NCCP-28]|nr:hypothetical protein NCCP28_32430 [Niallia sp. NCCP-28]